MIFQVLLSEILKESDCKLLMQSLKDQKGLTDLTRQLLVDHIVKYFIENNRSLTVAMCKSLSQQIIKHFPEELTN